jgi:tripartite-type tricarboxylate transporter receptor subunit TctC
MRHRRLCDAAHDDRRAEREGDGVRRAPCTALCAALRATLRAALLGTVIAGLAGAASAQAFPAKPITLIVPFSPGGGADTLARTLQPRLAALWGQPVVVENRPGASGHIGADIVAKAPADGHTLLMASTAAISERNVGKFAPIALVSAEAYVLVVNAAVPARDIRELVALAKARPDSLHFGSSGIGAASHLSGELFKARAGVKLVHVPYKGTGQALTDLLAGHIELMFAPVQTVLPQLSSGKIRALAVTGSKPIDALPGVPTVMASGVPDYQALGWFGLLAPAGTPAALLKRLGDDVNGLLAQSELRRELAAKGADPGKLSAGEFGAFVRTEQQRWTQLIQDAGIVLE